MTQKSASTSSATFTRHELPVAARRHALVHEVERQLETHGGHSPGDYVVIGVSGGADSVALLLAFAALRSRTQRSGGEYVRPVAVHVHHHLRECADQDAAFVSGLCKALGVTCHSVDIDTGSRGGNLSATARALRYHALAEQAGHVGARLVAVAHHAEDQLETIIMALCRGTGLDGLAGMPWIRELKNDVQLFRPLLAVRRADCEDLCRTAGVQWIDDPTNREMAKTRARLRHDVLPILDELWPDAPRRATGTAELVRAASAALEHVLETVFGSADNCSWDRAALAGLDPAVRSAGLRRAAVRLAPEIADKLGHRHLDEAGRCIGSETGATKQFDWPDGLQLTVDADSVRLERAGA